MLTESPPIVLQATTDAGRARRFYEDVLGLRFVADDPVALVFDLAGVTLRIARVAELTPQPFAVLGWRVDDIERAVRGLSERGVRFERYPGMEQDAAGIWRSPGGSRVAWFKDPTATRSR